VHPADAADNAEARNEPAAPGTALEPLLPAARYLPATARMPERGGSGHHRAEPRDNLPVLRTAPLPAVRHRAGPPSAGRRRRRGLLIAAGALAVAGLGTVAAAVPHIFNGGTTDQSLPGPGVTVAMASSDPDTATADAPSASAAATSPSAAASAAATRRAAAQTSTSARPAPSSPPSQTRSQSQSQSRSSSASPSPTPPSSTPSASAAASASAALAGGSTSLQFGDSGSAVATLQSQLRALWIDPGLKVDGDYGSRTEQDVATFQVWFGVQGDPSGVYGPNSQAKMAQLQHQH
jgi:hypothetical protein